MTTKIAVYGFGSMPVIQRHLVELARSEGMPVGWCAILTQPNYRAVIREVLPEADILDVFRSLPRQPVGAPLSELADYPGSLAEDMAAQKRQWWPRSGKWLQNRGIDYYLLYKSFLARRGATHLLTGTIETPDGKIIVAAARALGLGVMVPIDLRVLTGTMITSDAVEGVPAHARATVEDRARASAYVAGFRTKWRPARAEPDDIDPDQDDRTQLDGYLPSLGRRIPGFVRTAIERPDLFDPVAIRVAIMNNFGFIREPIRRARARRNAGFFDVSDPARLPEKFVFYPLQYSPEASINTPAPYFVDQFRVLDALRFAMPSDCALVVKEHWACLEMRPTRFLRRLARLPGVVIASSDIPARELVMRAGLTVSVTGTAVIEAFLSGRPAVALGPGMAADLVGGVTPLGALGKAIRDKFGRPVPTDEVVERVARLYNARYPFYFGTPHQPGEPMLRRGNLARFLAAIRDHLAREAAGKANAALDLAHRRSAAPT